MWVTQGKEKEKKDVFQNGGGSEGFASLKTDNWSSVNN